MTQTSKTVLIAVIAMIASSVITGAFVLAWQSVRWQEQTDSLRQEIADLRAAQRPSAETPSPAPAPAPTPSPTPITAVSSREPFGPLVSPDGTRVLLHEQEDLKNVTVGEDVYLARRHRLITTAISGGQRQIVLTVDEYRNPGSWEARPGYRGTSSWTAAGWSADGKNVYYLTTGETDGLGGNYPSVIQGGEALHEVNVQSGKDSKIQTASAWYVGGGLYDVYATKNRTLFVESGEASVKNLYLSALDGSGKKKVFASFANQVISAAIFNPSATRVAMVTGVLDDDNGQGWGEWKYTLYAVDPSDGSSKRLAGISDPSKVMWVDDVTISINGTRYGI